MKTTENLTSLNEINELPKSKVLSRSSSVRAKLTPLQARSLRPAKSMVKLRSLKPKRIEVSTNSNRSLKRKPIKA